MNEMLRRTWEDVAYRWNEYESPLRPHEQDTRIMRAALMCWHARNPVEKANVFLCGVTPEIAAMDWPFPINLIAMDQAHRMVELVWPGDVPGVRRAIVGDWRESGLGHQSQDIVIGDGGFAFFTYPSGQRTLINELHHLLRPGGLFLYRYFAQLSQRESMNQILIDLMAGKISNFHSFKWRVAMALQMHPGDGVAQNDIWDVVMHAKLDRMTKLPPKGWTAGAINTIHFYRGKTSRLYFPTLEEFRSLLAEEFDQIEVDYPTYELGERCPTVSAIVRGNA
jgi:hypothetical protein